MAVEPSFPWQFVIIGPEICWGSAKPPVGVETLRPISHPHGLTPDHAKPKNPAIPAGFGHVESPIMKHHRNEESRRAAKRAHVIRTAEWVLSRAFRHSSLKEMQDSQFRIRKSIVREMRRRAK